MNFRLYTHAHKHTEQNEYRACVCVLLVAKNTRSHTIYEGMRANRMGNDIRHVFSAWFVDPTTRELAARLEARSHCTSRKSLRVCRVACMHLLHLAIAIHSPCLCRGAHGGFHAGSKTQPSHRDQSFDPFSVAFVRQCTQHFLNQIKQRAYPLTTLAARFGLLCL